MTLEGGQDRVCRFPGCDRPAAASLRGVGRPPEYCEDPGHNRAAAWRARQRTKAEPATRPVGEGARPVDAARARAEADAAAAEASELAEDLQARLQAARAQLDEHEQKQVALKSELVELRDELAAMTAQAETAERERDQHAAAAQTAAAARAAAQERAADAVARTDAETDRAKRAEAETAAIREQLEQAGTLRGQLAAMTAEREAARRDADREKAHAQQRVTDLRATFEQQINHLRDELDHARARHDTEDEPGETPAATPPAAGTESPPPRARTSRRKRSWHVIETTEPDNPQDAVVVLSSHASEAAARTALGRLRAKAQPGITLLIRADKDIHRHLAWDTTRGRGIIRDGPPG